MVRRRALLIVTSLAVACSCTAGGSTPPPARGSPPAGSSSRVPTSGPTGSTGIRLDVIADVNGVERPDHPYVDGMQLAIDEVNRGGGVGGRPLALSVHDSRGDAVAGSRLLRKVLAEPSPALLYVGEGPPLARLRVAFQRRAKPVFLLKGDLYSSRDLFRQVFQTTIPWEWQAHVIGRYVVRDRRAKTVGFIGFGEEANQAERSLEQALEYWGDRLAWGASSALHAEPTQSIVARARRADVVVLFGPAEDTAPVAATLSRSRRPPRIVGGADLLGAKESLSPGSAACYLYTWAGWAEPIRRVGAFRRRFRAAFGSDPNALEQEGYDAVRVLAAALARTGGAGGRRLIGALEAVKGRVLSGFPVDIGPDDHVLPPRDELGLFAVAGPDERVDPWQRTGTEPWRALMRTFTYDGKRTNILDMDRRVFFPFWRKNRPGPEFWRSRYGIRSRARLDPLH